MSTGMTNAIIIVVSVVWVANFAARFVVPGYQPAAQIDAIFMAIVGGAVALNRKKEGGGGDGT